MQDLPVIPGMNAIAFTRRCAPLRASKDDGLGSHPSGLAALAPQDDGNSTMASLVRFSAVLRNLLYPIINLPRRKNQATHPGNGKCPN